MSRNVPDFQAYQRTVAALWASSPLRREVDNPVHEAAAKLAEEVGEAIKEINGLAPPIGPMEPWAAGWKRLEAELGDVLFVAARVANIYGIDMGRAAQISLEKFAGRYGAGWRPGDPYPSCPGGSAECYFMEDRAAVAGSRCEHCGHVKEGAR